MAPTSYSSPKYNQPSRPRDRRPSRKSVTLSSRTSSAWDSPRVVRSQDRDAYTYDPTHLRQWDLPEALCDHIPANIRLTLGQVQKAGAATQSGFERLEKHDANISANRASSSAPAEDSHVEFEGLPSPKFDTMSDTSSVFRSDSSAHDSASSTSTSGCASPISPSLPLSQPMLPVITISLGSPGLPNKSNRSRERSFSTPLESLDAYSATELSYLRTEALPHLRHQCKKVDQEWHEFMRTGTIDSDIKNAFENWWAVKKCTAQGLLSEGMRLAAQRGIASTGMGWTAP